MTTLTITADGQVTLPSDVLRHLGVGPGDQIDVQLLPDGRALISPVRPQGSIQDLCGMFKDKVTRPVSIEEMNQVIADAWADH